MLRRKKTISKISTLEMMEPEGYNLGQQPRAMVLNRRKQST